MYTYFKNTDVCLTVNALGQVQFDRYRIINNMTSRFTMPDPLRSVIDEILNNDKLSNVKTTEDITKVINSVVHKLNDVIVPIMRASIVNASEINTIVNFTEDISLEDFVIIFKYVDNNDQFIALNILDITNIFRKLEARGIVISDNDRQVINSVLFEYIDDICKTYTITDLSSKEKEDMAIVRIKTLILKKIEALLLERLTSLSLRYMLDHTSSPPYAYLDETGKLILNRDMIYPLLCAMDYYVYDPESNEIDKEVDEFVNRMEEEIMKEVEIIVEENGSTPEQMVEISPHINISFLNRIKFIRENDIPLSSAVNLRYPQALLSQLNIEGIFIDSIVEFTTLDSVIEDLTMMTDLSRSTVEASAKQIVEENLHTYKLLKDTDAHISSIYNGVRMAYMQMLNKKAQVLTHNHGRNKTFTNVFNSIKLG